MCGLVGIISRRSTGFFHSDMELMQNLLLLDTLRGEDSTGVFTVMRDQSVTITKVGSHPLHLYTTAAWGKHKSKAIAQGRIMIGHNRKATLGKINSQNAHPFNEGHIVLAHNGTLREDHKKYANTEVDSHAVTHAFANSGAEETLKVLQAAFAFIWWDAKKNRLFALRNDERPLSLVITDELNVLCSESWMAEVLLKKSHKKIEKVIDLRAGQLFEFSLDGTFKESTVELRKAPVVQQTNYDNRGGSHRPQYPGAGGNWRDIDEEDFNDPKVMGSTQNGGTNTPYSAAAAQLVETTGGKVGSNLPYKKDDMVLVQINDVEKGISFDKMKVKGVIIEPGKPSVDFVGYFTANISKEAAQKLIMGPCIARVLSMTTSLCGPSAWMTGFELAPMTKIHNTDLAESQWNYVVKHVQCKDCGNGVHDIESKFTSVTRRTNTDYRVTCADCIENKLTGEMKDVFIERRLAALQVGVTVSPKPTSCALTLVKPEGSATVH